MNQDVAKALFETIRSQVSKETAFILVLQDDESGGLVSNLGSAEEVSKVLYAVAEEHAVNHAREADGTDRETRGSAGY